MRSVSRRRPADYVRPALGEARLTRMWSAVTATERAHQERRARRGRIAASLAAAAVIAALVIVVASRLRSSTISTMAGLTIDTGAASQQVSLPDGSALGLGPATRLRVVVATEEEVRLRLDRGHVSCDVTHRGGRRFVVEAERVEVEVRGTKFEVDVEPVAGPEAAVAVRVERGAVEVHDEGRALLASLKPGQAWESRGRSAEAPAASAAPEPAPAAAPTPAPTLDSVAPPAPTGSAGRGAALSPRALFERADAARLAGRHADAAADFDRFYRRFPNDSRAGLAAYELGRIRLGSLQDPHGAVEAFTAVIERAPGDSFREDAEAGRVEALAGLGDPAACRQARDAFLARYGTSPQARRVARLCGAR